MEYISVKGTVLKMKYEVSLATGALQSALGDMAALDAFWEAVSQPEVSHICQFPYGQDTLVQRMYVTSGEQEILLMTDQKNYWKEITLDFIAMSPRVVP